MRLWPHFNVVWLIGSYCVSTALVLHSHPYLGLCTCEKDHPSCCKTCTADFPDLHRNYISSTLPALAASWFFVLQKFVWSSLTVCLFIRFPLDKENGMTRSLQQLCSPEARKAYRFSSTPINSFIKQLTSISIHWHRLWSSLRDMLFQTQWAPVLSPNQKMVVRGFCHCCRRSRILFFSLALCHCWLISLVLCHLEIQQITLFRRSWFRQGAEKHTQRDD